MAEVTDSLALLSLEDDLTCSICLCPFTEPVSLRCGHSFCRVCLEETWSCTSLYFCPHCREHYPTKPQLKKNTVLSAVVETFRTNAGSGAGLDGGVGAVSEPAGATSSVRPDVKPKPIMCNMCGDVKAVKTCLTCITSFCSEHVRPHQENPLYRAHELCEPLSDFMERLCSEHGKLLEFFCARHERSICSSCLQQSHKECGFSSPAERRMKIETDLRDKLNILDRKSEKNQQVLMQMREQQAKLKDMAVVRKRAMEAEYQQIREMLQRDELEAMEALNNDLESGNTKLNTLMKKFNQNIEKMSSTRAEINNLLAKSDSPEFLKASVELPSVVNFDPFSPRINLDSKRVIAFHSSIVSLKEQINKILHEPVENRISLFRPVTGKSNPAESETSCKSDKQKSTTGVCGAPASPIPKPREPGEDPGTSNSRSQPKGGGEGKRKPRARDKKENQDHKDYNERKNQKGERINKSSGKEMNASLSRSMDHLDNLSSPSLYSVPVNLNQPPTIGPVARSELLKFPANLNQPPTIGPVARSELLKCSTPLTFDFRTAHKRVKLSDNNTRASVSDEPSPYPDIPARFTVCSQVLCSQGFSRGRHYWEVKMSNNNFCCLGLAYGSIDRKGPSSRLGRNAQSWCIEWFNVKLSAWHNSGETVLVNPNPSRVGVLLDCDIGSATFYNVQDRAHPIHTFIFPVSEPVYPAFWIFSSGSSVTLCKLNN